RRLTRSKRDWSSDVCSSDLQNLFDSSFFFTVFSAHPMDFNISVSFFQICYHFPHFFCKIPICNRLTQKSKHLRSKRFWHISFMEIGRASGRERVYIWELNGV